MGQCSCTKRYIVEEVEIVPVIAIGQSPYANQTAQSKQTKAHVAGQHPRQKEERRKVPHMQVRPGAAPGRGAHFI